MQATKTINPRRQESRNSAAPNERQQDIQKPHFSVWRQTWFIMTPKTGSKKLVEIWRPERDLDCDTHTHQQAHTSYYSLEQRSWPYLDKGKMFCATKHSGQTIFQETLRFGNTSKTQVFKSVHMQLQGHRYIRTLTVYIYKREQKQNSLPVNIRVHQGRLNWMFFLEVVFRS